MHTDVKTQIVSVTKKRQMDIKQHLETRHNTETIDAKFGQKCAGKCEDIAFIL